MGKLPKIRGFALATILVLMGVVFIGTAGLLSVTKVESRISRSQKESVEAYYVAEAGIQAAVWNINNSDELKEDLDNGVLSESWTYNGKIGALRDVTVKATSLEPGRAEIVAKGLVREDRYPAQRVVKAQIFRGSDAQSPLLEKVMFGYRYLETNSSTVNVSDGGFYTSGDQSYNFSTINAQSSTLGSVGNYTNNGSTVNSSEIQAANMPPPADEIVLPGFNFNALKDMATTVYTTAQFKELIKNGGDVNIAGPITYINGALNISPDLLKKSASSVNIVVHGLLVVNSVGLDIVTEAGGKTLTFTVVDDTGGPAGLIARSNLTISGSNNAVDIQGVLYASNHVVIRDSASVNISGSIMAGSIEITGCQNVNLDLDSDRIQKIIDLSNQDDDDQDDDDQRDGGGPTVIQISYWEEEY